VSLKHLNPSGKFPSGNTRFYYRPKGQKGVAMPDLPQDDPRFLAAYAAAAGVKKVRAPVVAGSLAAEIVLYKGSDHFKVLAPLVRARRLPTLDQFAEKYGHGRIKDLRPEHVEKDLSAFSGHPRNNRRRVWRGFGMWLKDAKRLPYDPTADVARAKTIKSDGHPPWSAEEVEAFRAFWPIGTMERLAFELIFWTGARVGDAIRLGEGNVDREGWLTFRQAKTGGDVFIPFRRELPEFAERYAPDLELLQAAIIARTERHITFLYTKRGGSRSPKSISQWFAAKARKAGITGKSAHGLRKSRAIALVEAGGGSPQIGAWTGHESLREIERYIRKFNRKLALSRTTQEPEVPTPVIQFQKPSKTERKSSGL
jgi:integrase